MDEEDLLARIPLRHAGQKCRITLALKNISMLKVKSRTVEVHSAEDLLRIALASCGNQRLVSSACPSLVKTGILAETGFIPEEQRGLAFSGFFLAWDRCIAAIGLAPPDQPWPAADAASAPRIPVL